MSRFVIGITRRHLLTDKRTVGYFELFLEFSIEETENRVVIPIVITVHIVNVAIVDAAHKVSAEFLILAFGLIVGVEADRTGRVDATHLFHYIRNNTVFLFGTFQIAVIVIELHFIVHCPEEQ